MSEKSLRTSQLEILLEILRLNQDSKGKAKESVAEDSESWKVLVYDKFGSDVVAPLLTVGDLREHGVTLHLLINKEREPISDAPAVYLLEPTSENIKLICKVSHFINLFNLGHNLYDA